MILADDPVIEERHHRAVDGPFDNAVTVQNVVAVVERDGEDALLASPTITRHAVEDL